MADTSDPAVGVLIGLLFATLLVAQVIEEFFSPRQLTGQRGNLVPGFPQRRDVLLPRGGEASGLFVLLLVDFQAIGNEGLRHVGQVRSLRILFLTDCKRVGDEGVASLSSLERMKELDLSGTSFTDSGLRAITTMRELMKLYLKRTEVTD
ncbi:MAG: hypothetical protein IID45_04450, partial [Planctomycetes bacterium]|nr:hypothetical protein [Planctomycetota bacterium]